MELKNKKVTVVGLAKSGLAACNLLLDKGAIVSVTDSSSSEMVKANAKELKAKKNIVDIEIGKHTERLIAGQGLVVISPGVPLNSSAVRWARDKHIRVIGEIELAFSFCPAEIIAITGTNGKTTVTTLIGRIFAAVGRKYAVCGNIGNPFSSQIDKLTAEHTVILEVSSFQLETIDKFKPKVAVILNLTSDHLDRYSSFDEYRQAKYRIFLNQDKNDWIVLGADIDKNSLLAEKTWAKEIYLSKGQCVGNAYFQFNSNYCAALKVASLFNISKKIALGALRDFKGLKHRLENVSEIEGIKFINDSKATNIDSTLWALNSLDQPVVLIAGGKDKGSDFKAVACDIAKRVWALVLLGEAREKLLRAFDGLVTIKTADNLSQAVDEAFHLARRGDCVLFSPMCSSFDMFRDYKHRGKVFKQEVYNLLNHKSQ